MRMAWTIAAGFLLASCGAGHEEGPRVGAYRISAHLSRAGKIFASPSAVVRPGVPAAIQVSGPDGYELSLQVTDAGHDQARVRTALKVAHASMAPSMVVRLGQPGRVGAGALAMELTVDRDG